MTNTGQPNNNPKVVCLLFNSIVPYMLHIIEALLDVMSSLIIYLVFFYQAPSQVGI